MTCYEVFIEIGITLKVEAASGEEAMARAHDALQVHALPGYDAEMIDKFTVEESYQEMEQGKPKSEKCVGVTTSVREVENKREV